MVESDFPIPVWTDNPIGFEHAASPAAERGKAESASGEKALSCESSTRRIANILVDFLPHDRGQQHVRIKDVHAESRLPATRLK